MPKLKAKSVAAMPQQEKEVVYPTEKLLKSKHLSKYQPDFARAILTEAAYSISGAKAALDSILKNEER